MNLVWMTVMIFVTKKITFTMSQEFPTVSLAIFITRLSSYHNVLGISHSHWILPVMDHNLPVSVVEWVVKKGRGRWRGGGWIDEVQCLTCNILASHANS